MGKENLRCINKIVQSKCSVFAESSDLQDENRILANTSDIGYDVNKIRLISNCGNSPAGSIVEQALSPA